MRCAHRLICFLFNLSDFCPQRRSIVIFGNFILLGVDVVVLPDVVAAVSVGPLSLGGVGVAVLGGQGEVGGAVGVLTAFLILKRADWI